MAGRSKWGKQAKNQQPDGKVRLSQMVMGYGPGAMVDLLDHAVLIGGLEFWHYDKSLALRPYDDAVVLRVIDAIRANRPIPREPLRTAEFKQFLAQPQETPGEQPGPEDTFFARRLAPGHGLPPNIASVVLAHRLRELRVQVGFTRLEPVTANLQGEYDLKVRTAALSQTEKWLPANEIKGEGILLVLDEQAVAAWEQSQAVQQRGGETGTPGSEGTLGGLVEQGRRLRTHLQRAYDLGVLCSNDPLCGTHSPAEDPGERFLEGAACHGCLFVAECSCERFNRYLDRALVVPTIGHPAELAFFSKRP
jgi:hypothetical protein